MEDLAVNTTADGSCAMMPREGRRSATNTGYDATGNRVE
jgi:hypothetical protein